MKQISNAHYSMLLRCIPELAKIKTTDIKLYNAIRQLIKFQKHEKLKVTKSAKHERSQDAFR